MLASIPASILNHNRADLGISDRFSVKSSRSSALHFIRIVRAALES
jgi:hypothetical protein